jgi:CheY-like chemotaxis protein
MTNILIVEDDPNLLLILQTILRIEGYTFTVAQNGKEALQVLSEEKFDMVFMDIQMPVMNGVEAAKRIRNGDSGMSNRMIPIVALTSFNNLEIKDECIKAGMNMFLSKPASRIEIKSILKQYLY